MSRAVKFVLMTAIEWLFLVTLWMLFVSQWKRDELLIGVAAAAVGAIADGIVKMEDFAKFKPKFTWLTLIFWEPWYVLEGAWVTLKAFLMAVSGRQPQSKFEVADYKAVGDDAEDSARRALAVAYLSIPPNSIIIGIDQKEGKVLTHELLPVPTSLMAKKLGVDG